MGNKTSKQKNTVVRCKNERNGKPCGNIICILRTAEGKEIIEIKKHGREITLPLLTEITIKCERCGKKSIFAPSGNEENL